MIVKQEEAASFMVKTTEYFIPLGIKLNVENELVKIREDLDYFRGFLSSVMKKLDNERFVQNAPADVLELERKKKSDTELKIKSLEERLEELKKVTFRSPRLITVQVAHQRSDLGSTARGL